MNATVAKFAGWAQFLLQFVEQTATTGIPHTVVGWVGLAGSLAIAIGMHASSNTDGTK